MTLAKRKTVQFSSTVTKISVAPRITHLVAIEKELNSKDGINGFTYFDGPMAYLLKTHVK